MPYPVFLAGQSLKASLLSAMQPIEKTMTSDQQVLNSTTLTPITELIVPLAAGGRYEILMVLHATGAATSDLRTDWDFPAGSSGWKTCWGMAPAGTDRLNTMIRLGTHGFGTDVVYGMHDVSNGAACIERGMLTVGGTAGNWTPRFCQQVIDAGNPVRLFAGSYAIVRRVA